MEDGRASMDGRDQSEEGEHVTFPEAGLGLEGLGCQQIAPRSQERVLAVQYPSPPSNDQVGRPRRPRCPLDWTSNWRSGRRRREKSV